MYDILKKQKIGQEIYELQIEAPHIVKYAKPGNFIILRINENGERTPFTIADMHKSGVTIVFKVAGKTTADLSKLKKGNKILDVVGPLGNEAMVDEFGTVCLVGGGTGCVTTYILSKVLKALGNKIINITGAKTKDHLIWSEKFSEISDNHIVCTNDGSAGEKCDVTKPLERIVRTKHLDRVIVVGPPEMMKEAARLTYQRARTFVHLSPIMMDGIGMCGGCRVKVGGETKFACIDGPEFDAHDVDFDSLIYRNMRFNEEEEEAFKKHHKESCVSKFKKKKKSVKKKAVKKVKAVKKIKKPAKIKKSKSKIKAKKIKTIKKKKSVKKKVIKKKIVNKKIKERK